jgi:hypothetical protein
MRNSRNHRLALRGLVPLAALPLALCAAGCEADTLPADPGPGSTPSRAFSVSEIAEGVSSNSGVSVGSYAAVRSPTGGAVRWARRFGGPGEQLAYAVGVEPGGDVLVGGSFSETADFGFGPVNAGPTGAGYVARLGADGTPLWAKRLGGNGGAIDVRQVAGDPDGNVIIGGHMSGTVDLGDQPVTAAGQHDLVVVSYDRNGKPRWGRRFGDAGDQHVEALAVDRRGDVVVMGWAEGRLDFGTGPLPGTGALDLFVAKLDTYGQTVWARRWGNGQTVRGRGVAVDQEGRVTVVGHFTGYLDLGLGSMGSGGGDDAFILRLDAGGAPLWNEVLGGAGGQQATGVAVDDLGDAFVTGTFAGTIDLGGGSLTSAGGNDLFLAKLDGNGKEVWAQRFGDAASNGYLTASVAVDGTGAPLLAGIFDGVVDFGGGRLVSQGSWSVYVARFDAAGKPAWSRRFGNGNLHFGRGLAVRRSGEPVLAGSFQGSLPAMAAAAPLVSAGGYDTFVYGLTP